MIPWQRKTAQRSKLVEGQQTITNRRFSSQRQQHSYFSKRSHPNYNTKKQSVLFLRTKCCKSLSRRKLCKNGSFTVAFALNPCVALQDNTQEKGNCNNHNHNHNHIRELFCKLKQLREGKTLSKMSKHMQYPGDCHVTRDVM